MGFSVVTAAAADDPCDVGIYDAAGNKLASSGSTTGKLNSTGAKTVPLTAPLAVVAGVVYYAAFAYGPAGGAVAQLTMASLVNGNIGTLFGIGTGQQEMGLINGAFPLPATMTGQSVLTGSPILALMQ